MPTLKDTYPLYLNNKAQQPNTDLAVTDKFTGEVAFRTALASPEIIDEAIAGAVRAAEPMARLASYERQAVLQHCVERFTERFDELAYALCVEAGKPIKDSEGEVTRLIDTFRIAAEESVRMYGEVMPLDISARARGYQSRKSRFSSPGTPKIYSQPSASRHSMNRSDALRVSACESVIREFPLSRPARCGRGQNSRPESSRCVGWPNRAVSSCQ